MPYKSQAQSGYFHTHEKEIGKSVVKEFDKTTKGKHLIERVKKRIDKNREKNA